MELRPDLMPPQLDPALIARLAELGESIDGAAPGSWEGALAEYNRLAGTALRFESLQEVYSGNGHRAFARQLLFRRHLAVAPHVSVEELTEIVSRVMSCGPDHDFYLELFLARCKHPSRTDLIYWPDLVPELPQGREPTAGEVAELALRGRAEPGAAADGPRL